MGFNLWDPSSWGQLGQSSPAGGSSPGVQFGTQTGVSNGHATYAGGESQGGISNAFTGNNGALGSLGTTLGSAAATAGNNASNALNNQAPTANAAANVTAAQLGAAPTVGGQIVGTTGVNQSGAGYQGQLMGQLAQQAGGNDMGFAQNQFANALGQTGAAQAGLAATMGGRNSAAAQRNAAIGSANAAQGLGSQLANTKIQEQLAAQGQLAGVAGTVQGQNLGEAQFAAQQNQYNANNLQQANLANQGVQAQYGLANQQAANTVALANQGVQQQTNLANLQANLTNQGQGYQFAANQGALQGSLLGQQIGTYNQQTANQQALAQFNASNYNAAQGYGLQEQQQQTQNQNTWMNAASGLGSTALMMLGSDENIKHDVVDAHEDITDWLGTLGEHTYSYDEPDKPGQAEGRFTGPMAQELELHPLSRGLVHDTPDGKMVNFGRSIPLVMSALANIDKRLKKINA